MASGREWLHSAGVSPQQRCYMGVVLDDFVCVSVCVGGGGGGGLALKIMLLCLNYIHSIGNRNHVLKYNA